LLWRVGSHIDYFEACSMFTHVAARTVRWLPAEPFLRVLQVIRRLLTRPECFRLEREFAGPDFTGENGAPWQGTHNNIAENAMRPLALGRKNYLFAGSDTGGHRAAAIYTIVQTAKLNGVNPEAYLKDILTKIADGHPINRIGELLPWRLAAATAPQPP
jgi:hypothetical protein